MVVIALQMGKFNIKNRGETFAVLGLSHGVSFDGGA